MFFRHIAQLRQHSAGNFAICLGRRRAANALNGFDLAPVVQTQTSLHCESGPRAIFLLCELASRAEHQYEVACVDGAIGEAEAERSAADQGRLNEYIGTCKRENTGAESNILLSLRSVATQHLGETPLSRYAVWLRNVASFLGDSCDDEPVERSRITVDCGGGKRAAEEGGFESASIVFFIVSEQKLFGYLQSTFMQFSKISFASCSVNVSSLPSTIFPQQRLCQMHTETSCDRAARKRSSQQIHIPQERSSILRIDTSKHKRVPQGSTLLLLPYMTLANHA